jgi:opacity protein-like surface antigen
MAFMGSAQFRKGKFGILLDAVYAKLSTDGTWLQERVSTETETKLGFYTAALSYRVYDEPRGFVDVYSGARYFDASVDFELSTTRRARDVSADLDWTDWIVGVHGGYNINDRWSLRGFADYGGWDGASDQSWEIYGGANYAFSDRWLGTLGYRYISIQKEVTDRLSLDIDIQGPLIGISYTF